MAVEGVSDQWNEEEVFPYENAYPIKAIWGDRKVAIQPAEPLQQRIGKIFQEKQVELSLLEEALKREGAIVIFWDRWLEYPISFEEDAPYLEIFQDPESLAAQPAIWNFDPKDGFILAPPYLQARPLPCGWGKKIKKFWKKHKTEILIGGGIVLGAGIAVTIIWAVGGSSSIAAGGALLQNLFDDEPSPSHTAQNPQSPSTLPPPDPSPSTQSFSPPKHQSAPNSNLQPPLVDYRSMLPSSQSPAPSFPPLSLPPPGPSGEIKMPFPAALPPSFSPPANVFPNVFSSQPEGLKPLQAGPTIPQPISEIQKRWDVKPGPVRSSENVMLPPTSEPISKFFPPLPAVPGVNAQPHPFQGMAPNLPPSSDPTSLAANPQEMLQGIVLPDLRIGTTFTGSTSGRLPTLGPQNPDLLVMGINGINTSANDALSHQAYLSRLLNGRVPSDFIYNRSNGVFVDLFEVFALNYFGVSPNTESELLKSWQEFANLHKDNPGKKILQHCHSQGAIHVYNALKSAPQELKDRIIVVAIAPAITIPKAMCYDSFNYASNRDIVPLGEVVFTAGIVGAHPDLEPSEAWTMLLENRKELILLEPHTNATGIDHDFQSPTFQPSIERHLNNHYNCNGEYP